VQARLKKNGQPWEISKAFRGAAVIGPWVPLADFPNYMDEAFTFELDGQPRQEGHGTEMQLSPSQILAYAHENFPLCEGDVVFTGKYLSWSRHMWSK
jgi:2-keto-4-pentenoate hydratase/2-oxohepta-3-ene-1,7-dioic acid hydratase in catechol pathway